MNDDDLQQRLRAELRAIADHVPVRPGLAEILARVPTVPRADRAPRPWTRVAIVAAAALLIAAALGVLVVANGTPDPDRTRVVQQPSGPTSTTAASAPPPSGSCAVSAATIATDLGRSPADVNGGHDCSGDWGWIDLECTNPDPEVGCIHSGNIVHRIDGRWTLVDALLQDCAESFTAYGAPAEDAERLFRRCDAGT